MPIDYKKTVAVLAGTVTVEDAEILLQWLQQRPKAKVDLAACTHLHAAVLQVLMMSARPVSNWPCDADLNSWLGTALAR